MHKNIHAELFEIRPTDEAGALDVERVKKARKAVVNLQGRRKILWAHAPNPLPIDLGREPRPEGAGEHYWDSSGTTSEEETATSKNEPTASAEMVSVQQLEPAAVDSPEAEITFARADLLREIEGVDEHIVLPRARTADVPLVQRRKGLIPPIIRPTAIVLPQPEAPKKQEVVLARVPTAKKKPKTVPKKAIAASISVLPPPQPKSLLAPIIDLRIAPRPAASKPLAPVMRASAPVQKPVAIPAPVLKEFAVSEPKRYVGQTIVDVAKKSVTFSKSRARSTSKKAAKPRRRKITITLAACALLVVSGLAVWGMVHARKSDIMASGQQMFHNIEEGLASLKQKDWGRAAAEFQKSALLIASLREVIDDPRMLGLAHAGNEEEMLAQGQTFLNMAHSVTDLGTLLARIGERGFSNLNFSAVLSHTENANLLTDLTTLEDDLGKAQMLLGGLKKEVTGISLDAVPEAYQQKFFGLIDELPVLQDSIDQSLDALPLVRAALGENGSKKYLLLLLNSSELRPNGGFPGTYGIAEFENGRLKTFFLDGIYNPDGQLKLQIAPPKPLSRVSPFWAMRDAGWFFDFPTSARKFQWFYEREAGGPVDGVIAITPRFIERMLELTGSFAMPEYGQDRIGKDNFIEVLQFEVEADADPKLNNPKKILSDLAPKFLERLGGLGGADVEKAFEATYTSLSEKDIQLFFNDRKLQDFVERAGWSGRMQPTPNNGDYLAIVHANVAGGKADWVSDDTVLQEISVAADGTLTKTVSITRHHRGGGTPYAWWNAQNKDYLRLLVPRGSTLLAATGFTERESFSRTPQKKGIITDPDLMILEGTLTHEARYDVDLFRENDKDAFAGWLVIPPGESRTITLRYLLPARLAEDGNLDIAVQRQPGAKVESLTTRVLYPETWDITGLPTGASVRKGTVEITGPFMQDVLYRLQFSRDKK